jgi:hypothetical protein
MNLNAIQVRDLGERFQKLWNQDNKENDLKLRGMTETMDALGIPWRLNPGASGFDSVTIAGKTFKL